MGEIREKILPCPPCLPCPCVMGYFLFAISLSYITGSQMKLTMNLAEFTGSNLNCSVYNLMLSRLCFKLSEHLCNIHFGSF